jgi:hypothetical protein
MRPLIFSLASLILSIAFQLTLAKYGTEVPDLLLLVLWVVPLAPFGWWLWTHDKLLSRREKMKQYFRLHLWRSIVATVATMLIVTACLLGVGYTGWKMFKNGHESANKDGATSIPPVKEKEPPPPKAEDDTPKVRPIPNAKPPKQPTISQSNQMPLGGAPAQTQQPPMTQFCDGGSCAQSSGQTGGITAGTVNVNERPLPQVKVESLESLAGIPTGSGDYTHPGVTLHLSINGRFEDPTFLARCDRPCAGMQGSLPKGSCWPNSGTVDNKPNVAWLHFTLPSILQSGELIDWDIRSKDNQPIKILEVIPYRIP